MNCEKEVFYKDYKALKVGDLNREIADKKRLLKDLQTGKLRQCHDDILNTYVINSRINQLEIKLRTLISLKAKYKSCKSDLIDNLSDAEKSYIN